MPSDTKNVKLGVCKLFYKGRDLGYTQGGTEFSVTTETHEVMVDQFGKMAVSEQIIGRKASVKTNLAETTLDNLMLIMPGATLTDNGTKASGTIGVPNVPSDGDTVVVNGTTVTFKTAPTVGNNEVKIGAAIVGVITAAQASARNLQEFLDASTDVNIVKADYALATTPGTVINVVYDVEDATLGNAFTLVKTGTVLTVSGATLSGGAAATKKYVTVNTGLGVDLLSVAGELRLHPKNKADNDMSDDLIIPLAATPGALSFAYQLDKERVFNVEWKAYPDSTTANGDLFILGDRS